MPPACHLEPLLADALFRERAPAAIDDGRDRWGLLLALSALRSPAVRSLVPLHGALVHLNLVPDALAHLNLVQDFRERGLPCQHPGSASLVFMVLPSAPVSRWALSVARITFASRLASIG